MGELDEKWQQRTEFEVVKALKGNIDGEFLTAKTPLGSLNHQEWAGIGWTAICTWISVKAQEAVDNGTPQGLSLRTIPLQDPEPWEAGTIEACLPALGELVGEIGVDKPIGAYSKAEILKLLWTGIKLYRAAEAGRDIAETGALLPSGAIGKEMMAG